VDVTPEMGPTEYFATTHRDVITSELEMLKSHLFSPWLFIQNSILTVSSGVLSAVTSPLNSLKGFLKRLSRFIRWNPRDYIPRLNYDEMHYCLSALPYELMALGATCHRACEPSEVGAVLLHDYRVYHRGTSNNSNAVRPVLYFTFSDEGYDDSSNYTGQTGCIEKAAFNDLSLPTQCVTREWERREEAPLAGKPGVFFGYC